MEITFEEAQRVAGHYPFTMISKPIGDKCNLKCQYCYYSQKKELYQGASHNMSDSVLREYIKQYIKYNSLDEVEFIWHGGEPLLAGIEFYKKVLEYQTTYNTKGAKIVNIIQSNGTLLNKEWCEFLKSNDFLLGVSLDGTEELHNRNRINHNSRGSFDKVIEGIGLLQAYGIEFNIMCVLTKYSEDRGVEIYRFFKSLGANYIQLLPAVDYINGTPAPWTISSKGYGNILIDIFNEWVGYDVGKCFVQIFDMTLCSWCGITPPLCIYQESCGNSLAIEHNGDIYSCDHYVSSNNYLGNILNNNLNSLLRSNKQLNFASNKHSTLPRECKKCSYYFACKGACPKQRKSVSNCGSNKYSLCEGIKSFYKHVEPYMEYMRQMLNSGKTDA